MKDLGFGLVEQRTVIVVLMTATLCSILGLNFPLHTDNILLAFVDLVFLTGYIYIARSIVRFPFAFCIGIWNAIKGDGRAFNKRYKRHEKYSRGFYVKIKGERRYFVGVSIFLVALIDQDIWTSFLGFIDRASLIIITVLVTLPTIGQTLMVTGGAIGIVTMLLIYLIGGSFGFIVEDALKKSADQRAEELKKQNKLIEDNRPYPPTVDLTPPPGFSREG